MQKFNCFDKKKHGTPDFPVEYYYVDSNHPRYNMAIHWHNEWELIRILKGKFLITLDDKQWELNEGEIVLVSGETLHGGKAFDCIYECLVFDLYGLFGKMDILKTQLRPFYNMEIMPEQFFTDKDKKVSEVLDIFSGAQDTSLLAIDTISAISGLFAWIIKETRYRSVQNTRWRSQEIKPVLEYIETHYGEELSLDCLADIAVMNARYFCKVFYLATKTTPMKYVNMYRIERAAFLLDSTDLPVTQIASDCGFCDSSYFTKVFKKYKGMTPLHFRTQR